MNFHHPRKIDLSKLCFENRRESDKAIAVKHLHESALEAEKFLDYGDPFLVDIYRITGTRKFRKLGHTMQMMLDSGGMFRSRLTHAIDSSVIARRIAHDNFGITGSSLFLTEAAALTHDLSQSPLGYSGDKAIKNKLAGFGISYNEKNIAVKVLTEWSNQAISFKGINPTIGLLRQVVMSTETYNAKFKGSWMFQDKAELSKYITDIDKTYNLELEGWGDIEGRIGVLADGFSWLSEDIMAGLNEGIFTLKELTENVPLAKSAYEFLLSDLKNQELGNEISEIKNNFAAPLSSRFSRFIKTLSLMIQKEMIADLVDETEKRYLQYHEKIKYADDARRLEMPIVCISDYMLAESERITGFFGKYMYPRLMQADGSFENLIAKVFDFLLKSPEYMSRHYTKLVEKSESEKQAAEVVGEYMNRELTDGAIIKIIMKLDRQLLRRLIKNRFAAKDLQALNDWAV